MTKYYCDICGKETSKVIEYTLPSMDKKEIYDNQENVVALSFFTTTKRQCLCECCADKLWMGIETFKAISRLHPEKQTTFRCDYMN